MKNKKGEAFGHLIILANICGLICIPIGSICQETGKFGEFLTICVVLCALLFCFASASFDNLIERIKNIENQSNKNQ